MTEIDTSISNIDNTFLPRCRSKKLSIDGLTAFVLHGFCKIDDLPPEIKKPVMDEIKKRTNATKEEGELYKTTIFEAQQSGGAYFITTKGKAGTIPGCKDHAEIMERLAEDSEFETQSKISVTPSLDDFLVKTQMIRIKFVSNTADMTIRTIPNQDQIKSLEDLVNIVSDITFDFKFKKIHLTNETKSFEDFLVYIKEIEKEDKND